MDQNAAETSSGVQEATAKHTREPWSGAQLVVRKVHEGSVWAYEVVDTRAGKFMLAQVGEFGTGETDAVDRAWASLFAAAPDLLAACKAQEEASAFAAEASEGTPDGKVIPKHLMDKADQLFRHAAKLRRTAIAKAEGRTPEG